MQAYEKECAMKLKERNKGRKKKRLLRKNFFDGRKDFVWLYQKSDMTELRVNNSSHTKGTICLVNK